MNVFLQEWRMGRKSLYSWIISLLVLTGFFMMFYNTLSSQMNDLLKLLESFPVEFQQAFGVDNFKFGGAVGFYSFILTYVLLAGCIQAMNLGVATLSAEVRDKTADFLYAKPVSRPMIITQKILAVLAQIVLTNICFATGTWFIIQLAIRGTSQGTIDLRLYLLLTGTLLLLQVFFVAIGLIVSAFIRRIRTVLPISMGVVFFFYILYLLNDTLKNEKLAFLSPFSYFELGRILETEAYELKFVITFAVLVIVFIGATYGIYMKKDLPSI